MRKYKIPVIKRPIKLCGEAPIIDVYKHAFKKINKNIKIIVGLQPDHPDRNKKLDDVINKFQKKKEIFYIAWIKKIKRMEPTIFFLKIILGGKIRKELKVVDNCTNIHFLKDFRKAEKNIKKYGKKIKVLSSVKLNLKYKELKKLKEKVNLQFSINSKKETLKKIKDFQMYILHQQL